MEYGKRKNTSQIKILQNIFKKMTGPEVLSCCVLNVLFFTSFVLHMKRICLTCSAAGGLATCGSINEAKGQNNTHRRCKRQVSNHYTDSASVM